MYLNCLKTKMNCILVFFNYHTSSHLFSCVPLLWAFMLQVRSKYNLSCDHIHVLAKSCDICPQFTFVTTLSSSIQVSHLTLPFYFLIMTTGSSSFLKVTSYSFKSRTPPSLSMPKSGNICGRRYKRDELMWNQKPNMYKQVEMLHTWTELKHKGSETWHTAKMKKELW